MEATSDEPFGLNAKLLEQVFRRVWAEKQQEKLNDSDSEEESISMEKRNILKEAATVTKIQQDALKFAAEYLRLFLVEALHRAQLEAMIEDSSTIEPQHLEQILAQLLLDF